MKLRKLKFKSPFSDLGMEKKFILINLSALLTIAAVFLILFNAVRHTERERQSALENMTVLAAEQYMNTLLENGVSIARSSYTNSRLYEFLNEEYASSSAYFDAYYQFQQDNPLMLAEMNIIDNYTLFTANETIMSGGHIRGLRFAVLEGWYQTLLRKNKPMLLYCDTESQTLSLIRRLDYYDTSAGECFLKLDLNMSVLRNYCDALHFDGELDIVGEGILLYSSQSGLTIEDVQINREFEGLTRNYYTVDIEYYAKANKRTIVQSLTDSWPLLVFFTVMLAGLELLLCMIVRDMQQRARNAEVLFLSEGTLAGLHKKDAGTDDIGTLIQVGVFLSEKITLKNTQFRHSQRQLAARQTEFRELYGEAMRQDAELMMQRRYPSLCLSESVQKHPLAEELKLVKEIAGRYALDALSFPESVPETFAVPVYALALIADDLLRNGGTMQISFAEDMLTLLYRNSEIPSNARILKLGAIFEEGEVSNEYAFRPQYAYNPYLYLKHCFGNQVKAAVTKENGFVMKLTIIN